MKKLQLLFVLMLLPMVAFAQLVPNLTDNEWTVLFQWVMKDDGYYHLEEGGQLSEDINSIKVITHNKKKNEMYAADEKGCYHVKLHPNWSAYVKNEYKYEKLNEEEVQAEIERIKRDFEIKIADENNRIKLKREAAKQAAIKKEKEKEAARQQELAEYKKKHPNYWDLPINGFSNKCLLCDRYNTGNVVKISGDTVFTCSVETGLFGFKKQELHALVLTDKDKSLLATHMQVYGDSLKKSKIDLLAATGFNYQESLKYLEHIKKKAPFGFIERWGWELNSADGIEPSFSFFNTSKKTIKYLDFYFSIYNAVGDRCYLKYDRSYIGKVRGVGPVESYESGSWNWDRATHYTSGDATEMRIIKLVITYMDGTQKTIPKNMIVFYN